MMSLIDFKPQIPNPRHSSLIQSQASYSYLHRHPSCWNECSKLTTKMIRTLQLIYNTLKLSGLHTLPGVEESAIC